MKEQLLEVLGRVKPEEVETVLRELEEVILVTRFRIEQQKKAQQPEKPPRYVRN